MAEPQAPSGGSAGAESNSGQDYQRLKPNAVGLIAVVFMAVATAAPTADFSVVDPRSMMRA